MSNKYAVITGASRGIGAGIAKKLASKGYNLALICEKNKQMQQELATQLSDKYGIKTLCYVGDVSIESFVSDTRDSILKEFPKVDVLVNNAGIWEGGLVTDISPASFKRLLDVNLFGYYLMVHYFVPAMVSQKSGNIINISSVWGLVGASCECAYSATKGGINAFTQALAKELAPSHVRVNAIAPGVIDTDMNRALSEETRDMLKDEIGMGYVGSPEDVGDVALAILDCGYMTGQILTVDGSFI